MPKGKLYHFFTLWSLLATILCAISAGPAYAHEHKQVRRWYVVLYDQSTSFDVRSDFVNRKISQTLTSLFDNTVVMNREAKTGPLEREQLNNVRFFDPDRDNISLYYFGMRRQEADKVTKDRTLLPGEQYQLFADQLLSQPTDDWLGYHDDDDERSFEDFFNDFKELRPNRGSDYLLSTYAFPAVLTQLQHPAYDELIIIYIGSNLTHSKDSKVLKDDVFIGYPALVRRINARHEELNDRFDTENYFSYTFSTNQRNRYGQNILHRIVAFKVKPVVATSPVVALEENSRLKKSGFFGDAFRVAPATLRIDGNVLNISKIDVQVLQDDEVVFTKTIASGQNGALYDEDENAVGYDERTNNYYLPSVQVHMPGVDNARELADAAPVLVYNVYSGSGEEVPSVANRYQVRQPIDETDVSFENEISAWFTTILPLALLLAFILWFLWKRKPRDIHYRMVSFGDSFEKIDYRQSGRMRTPYRSFNKNTARIPVDISLAYSIKYLRWAVPINLRLEKIECPPGFDMHLLVEDGETEHHVFMGDTWRTENLKPTPEKPLKFWVVIKKHDPEAELTEPTLCRFAVSTWVEERMVWKASLHRTIEETFHIGPPISSVWIGLDPGTTGTCIAAGTHFSNVLTLKDERNRDLIEPSLVIFNPTRNPEATDWLDISPSIVTVGEEAEKIEQLYPETSYRSVKKLLGFTDKKTIHFSNGGELSLDGRQITALMIRHLLSRFNDRVLKSPEGYGHILEGDSVPMNRVCVAIPNNFTATKTQAAIDSINYLDTFTEIRAIPEAEAVMVYYIFNRHHLAPDKKPFEKEKALIFDMGGATINVSLLDGTTAREHGDMTYHIEVDGKLGYGIGGDTIDYCLLNILYEWIRDFRDLPGESIDFSLLDKEAIVSLLGLARKVKLKLIDHHTGKTATISELDIAAYLEEFEEIYTGRRGNPLFLDASHEVVSFFNREIYNHPLLKKLIYNNVRAAVSDILELASEGLDNLTLIFSGRSTLFPHIKREVIAVLRKRNIQCIPIAFKQDELKSAVARGACLYGVANNAITINSRKIHSHFGVIHSKNAGIQGFVNLVPIGSHFNGSEGLKEVENLSSSFALDGKYVRFVQVMGQDAEKIIRQNEQHKFSPIDEVKVHNRTKRIGVLIHENDDIRCRVEEADGELHDAIALMSDQEIARTNEKHYTWLL